MKVVYQLMEYQKMLEEEKDKGKIKIIIVVVVLMAEMR